MRFGPKSTVSRFRLKLMAPYALVFALMGLVGYQVTNLLSAEPLSGGVELSVGRGQYVPGEAVQFTITNRLSDPVFVPNNCPDAPLEVYRREGNQWVQLHDEADPAKCVHEPRTYEIAPGAEVSATYRYWPDLFTQPGRYKLSAPVEHFEEKPSVEFVVVQE